MKRRGILVVLGLLFLTLTTGYLLTGCNSSTASAANGNDTKTTGAQLSDYFKSTDVLSKAT
jgi:thiosulfate/3-mercaptopyruvate sulfurtransferase